MADWVDSRALSAQEIERLSDAIAGTYVSPSAAGGAVTQDSGGASMTVDISAILGGFFVINGTQLTAAVAASSLTLDGSDASSPRRDAIWVNTSGTLGKTTGTPLTEDTAYDIDDEDTFVYISPALPDIQDTEILLAEVYVAAGVTSVTDSDITDKRQSIFHSGHQGVIIKTADETIDTSTTMQDDDDFTFPVAVNSIYYVKALFLTNTGTTPDIKMDFSLPANAAHYIAADATAITHATATPLTPIAASGPATTTLYSGATFGGSATNTQGHWAEGFIYVTDTAGNVTLQWAQATSDAGNTSVLKNSWMKYERLGPYTA